jgi:SOS-response transcriptional repressor LexA
MMRNERPYIRKGAKLLSTPTNSAAPGEIVVAVIKGNTKTIVRQYREKYIASRATTIRLLSAFRPGVAAYEMRDEDKIIGVVEYVFQIEPIGPLMRAF